jgi:hypothetical protein
MRKYGGKGLCFHLEKQLSRRIMDEISARGHRHVDTTRPTLGFPLGMTLILVIVLASTLCLPIVTTGKRSEICTTGRMEEVILHNQPIVLFHPKFMLWCLCQALLISSPPPKIVDTPR